MRAILRVLCVLAVVGTSTVAFSQQYYSNGGVRRVIKYRILPGKTADFYKWLGMAPKVLGAEKDAGLIQDFSLMHSTEFVGPDKYDVVLVISYKDLAAVDAAAQGAAAATDKVFGSPENRAAWGKLGSDTSEVVSSELVREIHLK
jgi:hypothetical protein